MKVSPFPHMIADVVFTKVSAQAPSTYRHLSDARFVVRGAVVNLEFIFLSVDLLRLGDAFVEDALQHLRLVQL